MLAPTDPVLASDVQLAGPGAEDDADDADDEVRFALTSEAGLNDGLAFPITNLAIALAAGGSWFVGWVVDDVVVKLTVGLLTGLVLGRLIGWAMFNRRSQYALARTQQGFVALGATLDKLGGNLEAVQGLFLLGDLEAHDQLSRPGHAIDGETGRVGAPVSQRLKHRRHLAAHVSGRAAVNNPANSTHADLLLG